MSSHKIKYRIILAGDMWQQQAPDQSERSAGEGSGVIPGGHVEGREINIANSLFTLNLMTMYDKDKITPSSEN